MKKLLLSLLLFKLICTISIAQNGVAPKIISTTPAFADCNVDPALKEIVVKFDQDMGGGMSVIDIKNMPQSAGRAYWLDKRTFVIPVKLYENKLYSLAFNNSRFQNFCNTEGIPLNPEELFFKTKNVFSPTLNKTAYKELMEIFPKKYSYASLKGIDWKSLLEQYKAEFENAQTPNEFALKLLKLLRTTEDPHLWIDVEGQRFSMGRNKLGLANYGSGTLFSLLQDKKASQSFNATTGIIDSIGYISIRDWTNDFDNIRLKSWGNSKNPEVLASEVLKGLLAYPNLIIDVRENSGGNEAFAKKFASLFISDSIAYEKTKSYNEKTGKIDMEHTKLLYPNEKGKKYAGNVYVLSGPTVMSSNESFILMMKQVQNATVVGMKTYGSSGNPKPYELSNGVTIYLPSWQAYTPEGKLIEGNGIEPDVEILTSSKDFKEKDPLFEEVLKMINKKK